MTDNTTDNKGKASKKSRRAYSRYIQDPVFVGLVVLVLLLGMATFYFASNANCPIGAAVASTYMESGTVPAGTGDESGNTGATGNDNTAGDSGEGAGTEDTGDKLLIYEFSEFKCPFCSAATGFNKNLIKRFQSQDPSYKPAIPNIKEKYGDDVAIVFKHYIVHDSARKAAEAAECARDQGKFWEMHDIMFQNQGNLEPDDLKQYAAQIGLDADKFDSCLDSGEKKAVVDADTRLGREWGVTGTPTFFVGGENGYKVVGAQPFSAFEEPIQKALKGDFPEPPPERGESVASFDSLLLPDGICTEDGKPIVRLFTTTGCPHCNWIKDTFDSTVKEYVDEGKIVAHHWEVITGDDTLTEEVESEVPESELEIYSTFSSRPPSVPTFVFGCKYYRIGNAHEREGDLEAEAQDFREVIDALLEELAA